MFVVGIVAWAAAIGSCLLVEGIALYRPHDAWPTFSDIMRLVTDAVVGRWLLFALWLWLGWHLFVRGWQFFLRAPAGEGSAAGAESRRALALAPVALEDVLRQDVVPLSIVYVLVLAMLAYCARRIRRGDVSSPRKDARRGWSALLRHLLVTAGCGYAFFLGAVALFYGLVSNEEAELLQAAVTGGGFLAFVIAVPTFVLVSWTVAMAARR